MKKIVSLLPVICLAIASMSAKADTLTFNNNPSGTIVGPYNLTLSNGGGSSLLSLFCMNDQNEIQSNESWGVNMSNGLSYEGSATNSLGFEYEEEAYIHSQYTGANATDVQDALWTIFDPSTGNKDANSPALVNAAYSFALGEIGATGPNATLSGATFYVWDGGAITNQYGNSAPQNFVGSSPVPEPSTLATFGTGLFAIAGFARRRFARS